VISTKILPKFFKDVLQHIPTLALKSVNWKDVLKDMGPFVFRLGTKELEKSKQDTISNLKILNLELTNKIDKKRLADSEENKEQGQLLLKLYFSQFKNKHGLNLDIRASHFEYNSELLKWSPNNCWYKMSDHFREALIDLYSGFYHNNNERFERALQSIGLTKNLNDTKTQELKELFYAHFTPGDQSLVKFEVSKFSESFYELFHFFVTNEVELETDFIFLGIYLVTLYMHLEELDESFDVRAAFLEVFPN
jgi:hypothetical protein